MLSWCWIVWGSWFLFLFLFLVFLLLLLCGLLVGGGPTASYLFCFAKKGNPKKATTLPLAFGFPIVQDKKWESLETRCAQTQGFLYPFSVPHNWQCQKWMKVKVKNNIKSNGNIKTISTDGIKFSNSGCRSSLLTYPRLRRCNLCFTENG